MAEGDGIVARMVALTDGVVAIAMTLLVLDIALPDAVHASGVTWADLFDIREQIWGYVLSFLVVGLLWLTHAQKFRRLERFTGQLFWLNTLFLLAVGLVPFTTSLLAASGNHVATALYAGVMAFASMMLGLMTVHAHVAGLARGKDPMPFHSRLFVHFLSTSVFLVSIVISLWSATFAQWFWLLLIPIAFVPDGHTAS